MELFVIPKNNNISDLNNLIVGLKDFSTNYKVSLTLDQIEELSNTKKIMVAINKTMFNNEIKKLEECLIRLSELNIEGVLFYDLSVLSIKNRLDLKLNLIWNQTHMVTNYNTCNYYYDNNVYGAYLSNEITLEEQVEIKNNSKLKIMANIVFRPVIAHSRRNLITNYFKSINEDKKNNSYNIKENITKNNYIIEEDNTGTTIIYGNIINGIKPFYRMLENNFDYVVIDSSNLSDEEFNFSFSIINKIINNEIDFEESIKLSEEKLGIDTGFFYKKTIYRVKRG